MVYYSPNEQGDFCAGPKMSGQKQKGEVFVRAFMLVRVWGRAVDSLAQTLCMWTSCSLWGKRKRRNDVVESCQQWNIKSSQTHYYRLWGRTPASFVHVVKQCHSALHGAAFPLMPPLSYVKFLRRMGLSLITYFFSFGQFVHLCTIVFTVFSIIISIDIG